MPKKLSADLQVNQPVEGTAPDATLIIEVDPAKPVRVGTYVFQLRVTDDSGNVSSPTEARLIVVDEGKPIAIIDAPIRVPFGKGFTLSGERSSDVGGGKIVKFTWTLISAP
jgi:hypothetical protein